MKKRYYIRVTPFALATVIAALENDKDVSEIKVSKEDNILMVSYDRCPCCKEKFSNTSKVRV